MTISQLQKLCARLISDGHARKPVFAFKDSFKHPLEGDGAVILDVKSGELEFVNMADDDGGTKLRRDGTEAGCFGLVLCGDADERTRA